MVERRVNDMADNDITVSESPGAPPILMPEGEKQEPSRTLWSDAWYRLRRNRLALAALTWLFIVVIAAVSADLWVPQHYGEPNFIDTQTAAANALKPPTIQHPMGTDDLGRDVFGRVVYGARISLLVGIAAVLVEALIGLVLGALSGFYGGLIDAAIMRLADVFLAFPYILFAILLLSVIPSAKQSLWPVIVTIGLLGWPSVARVFRSSLLSVKESDYVEAGRAIGASDARLMLRHMLPNAIAPIVVYATMSVGGAILTEAALSFLNLGVQPDLVKSPHVVSWGRMISDGQSYLTSKPGLILWPGLAILSTVLAFTLLGDGVRDALDVKMKD
jgi:peptide/nickel transport system permease protein/oligopeptide transport system permease protein